MQEFEFVDNGVFEKDGVEYRNKGQVEIKDKLFYLSSLLMCRISPLFI